jgi:hypothetical protein
LFPDPLNIPSGKTREKQKINPTLLLSKNLFYKSNSHNSDARKILVDSSRWARELTA